MSDNDHCSNCAALEAENEALRQEIARLQRIIEELKRRLERIRRFVEEVLRRTRHILSQPKGVKFSKWKFSEGADAVADAVEKMTQ